MVGVNYFGSPQKAQSVVERIRKAGGTAEAYKADVRDDKQVADLVAQVRKAFGPIDILGDQRHRAPAVHQD